ncbi:glycerophosphoryl diester phosphodiesterase [Aciduliprofundum sp. MAR08-339]|uniref:glycerophosphodiester phosphodiesterase family protein n=1 Tax=Aciduliprofundum sp. (strain MAR08-339) TaxID=673860 RepID=UPI0002A4B058|nr:glycerophosphoryl diester phosphodiesterase [Aciduliprofundum sp. MAR08-339]
MIILGHRGYSAKYPPNTLLAFMKAIEYGADGVELDIWLTKDGEIQVSHDRNLRKTAGVNVDVKKSTQEEIGRYNIQGEPIPLLREVYEKLPGYAIINVEIKDESSVEGALKIVEEYDAMERTLFSSFNIKALKRLRKLSKEARIGILIGDVNKLYTIPRWIYSLKPHYLNLPYQLSSFGKAGSRALIRFYRLFGVRIGFWTPNSPEDLEVFEGLYEMVITDEVEKMLKLRERTHGLKA